MTRTQRVSWYSKHRSKADICSGYYRSMIWDNHRHNINFIWDSLHLSKWKHSLIQDAIYLEGCSEIPSGCFLGETSVCRGEFCIRWISASSNTSVHCLQANTASPFCFPLSRCRLWWTRSQAHNTCRVTEFLLAWDHSSFLALFPHNFAFLHCYLVGFCYFFFFTSFSVAVSLVFALKILAPLPMESFCTAQLRDLRRFQVLSIAFCSSGL